MSTTAEDERLLFDVGKIKHIVQNAHVFARTRTPRVCTCAPAHTHANIRSMHTKHTRTALTDACAYTHTLALSGTHTYTHTPSNKHPLSLSFPINKYIYAELPRSLNTFGTIFSRSKTLMHPLWIRRSRAEYSYLQSYFSSQSTLKLPKFSI